MKKLSLIAFIGFIFLNCKEISKKTENIVLDSKRNNEIQTESSYSNRHQKNDEVNNKINDKYWNYYNVSESSISGTSKKGKLNVIEKFKNIKIEIDDKNLKVGNLCSFEYYKAEKKPIKYYQSDKTVKLYETIFSKNGLKLGDKITVYQSLYPEKSCDNPWDEILIIDNTLVIVYDDYLVFLKKGNNSAKTDCFSKAKITPLPITKKTIDGNDVWHQLDCNIANLETKDYLRLPNINDIKVFIIGNFNYDDFTYTLITLKNNKVVTNKTIGFSETDDYNNVTKIVSFNVSNDYIINLDTKVKKEVVGKL
ncbi:hypothetical protein [Flavobacterium davisii]|uniref:Uncharacterized protein n=1 Tax=Flavobacterium columnare TaxID=996 RepID=A0A8G0P9N8_9FLAO|nr:hypothetical protein [Flavobacterium davisii]QYS88668.1 hypothetical protein JJC05_13950 [Flavobacterium davisii]